MCGICGILQYDKELADAAGINSMVSAMGHRGPDGSGVVSPSASPGLWLGHSRLAIIGPGADGAQPMFGYDDVIVYNGELYNYLDLKCRLSGKGYVSKTSSDTEVVLAAYSYWGAECLVYMRGIFAFAIWDVKAQCLFLARDQMGVKPLYYYVSDGVLVFASEVRSILASGLVPRSASLDGLDSLLAYGSVQEPYTLVEKVRSMPAASFVSISKRSDLSFSGLREYWRPSFEGMSISEEDYGGLVGSMLEASVKMQMISDVPLGVFLSSGIDSGALASLMRRCSNEVHSFTVSTEDAELDEGKDVISIARRLGTNHHELKLTREYIQSSLWKALDSYDQPGIDGLNTWFVSSLVSSAGIKVALSGLGGDEVFIGYNGFYRPLRLMRLQRVMGYVPGCVSGLFSRLFDSEGMRKLMSLNKISLPGYFMTRQIMGNRLRSQILGISVPVCPLWMEESFLPLTENLPSADLLNRISFWELSTYMRSTLLRDADQMGMANSLEIRVPLIDHNLVELMLKIPGHVKVDSKIPKHLLVNGAKLPEEQALCPKKGFDLPVGSFLRQLCFEEAGELFHNPPVGCFEKKALEKLWKAYLQNKVAWQRIWCIFTAMRWMRNELS